MVGLKRKDIARLRDRLLFIQYKGAVLWTDEDLDEIIVSKSSSWLKLLMWLLEQLCGESISADSENIRTEIQKTTVALGICNATQSTNLIMGEITPVEKINFLSKLINIVEHVRSDERHLNNDKDADSKRKSLSKYDELLTTLPKVLEPFGNCNVNSSLKDTKKKTKSQPIQNDNGVVPSYVDDNALCHKRLKKAKEKVERMRKELELEDNVTVSDATNQLCSEREVLIDQITMVIESWKPLVKEMKNAYETELKDLLPVDVADSLDIPNIDSLFAKVECLSQVQNSEKILENSINSLRNKVYDKSSIENWSMKKSTSLPVIPLYEDSQRVLLK